MTRSADGTQRAALARIRARAEQQRLARTDPRFTRVLARFVEVGLLYAPPAETQGRLSRGKLRVVDVLWAGQFEPRMLEVLPALLLERPELFRAERTLPEDLTNALDATRFGLTDGAFRGIAWEKLQRHILRARGKPPPAKLHAFRLRREDELLLERLAQELGQTRTDVLRGALRLLAEQKLLRSTESR